MALQGDAFCDDMLLDRMFNYVLHFVSCPFDFWNYQYTVLARHVKVVKRHDTIWAEMEA